MFKSPLKLTILGSNGNEVSCIQLTGDKKYVTDFIQEFAVHEEFNTHWYWREIDRLDAKIELKYQAGKYMKLSELLQAAAVQVKEQEDMIEALNYRCDTLEARANMQESKNMQLNKKLKELGGILYSAASILENTDNTY